MINIENFNPDLLKIYNNSYKNIGIYYIGYITIKDFKYLNINSINPLYIITGEVDGSFAENSGNKYLTLGSTDKNKKRY